MNKVISLILVIVAVGVTSNAYYETKCPREAINYAGHPMVLNEPDSLCKKNTLVVENLGTTDLTVYPTIIEYMENNAFTYGEKQADSVHSITPGEKVEIALIKDTNNDIVYHIETVESEDAYLTYEFIK